MKYIGIPLGMWVLFEKSFRKNLVSEFGYNKITAKQISKNAKSRYKSIIRNLPEFEKGDQFKTNIVGCAMLGAFVLSMPKRPSVDELTEYYSKAMMTRFMRWLCRQSGKKKFTAKDIAEMKKTAELKAADRNPYSWNMDFYEYSDGSGYEIARALGHTIVEPKPMLVPICVKESCCCDMSGLSLKNVTLSLIDTAKNKPVYREQGEMLFTHFGVSGPLVLSASAYVKKSTYRLEIDLKPALDDKKLNARLLRDFGEQHTKQISTVMRGLLPHAMVEPVLDKAGVAVDTRISEITKVQRAAIVNALKHFDLTVTGLRPIEEAIITDGGVSLKEIDPKTMGSKLIDGLYFAGEIIDCAAYTGGYNLQIAFSTGHLAGSCC